MAMKFNKDAMLKHRFWIIISVAIVLSLVGISYLGLVAADTTKLQALLTQTHKYEPTANEIVVEQSAKNAEKAKKSEAGIWAKASQKQQPILRWAENIETEFNFQNGFFTVEIKIDTLPASVKDWPTPDGPNTKSGKLTNVQPEWFEIIDKDNKKVKFHKTDDINGNITVVGEEKKLNFPQLRDHIGKLVTVNYDVGKYFGDPLTDAEQRAFAESYKQQVLDILKSVDPLNEKGDGVVQLKDWLFRNELPEDIGGGGGVGAGPGAGPGAGNAGKMPFIRYFPGVWGGGKFKNYSEEAWIAQENLWVQKEIYRIIREANDSISLFKGKAVEKKGETASFENSFFKAELTLDAKNNLVFKVKNRLPRGQKLDLLFRVKMNKNLQAELVKISGPMLTPAGSAGDFHQHELIPEPADSPRKGIYSVEQVLNWETAAVKRIDYISVGSSDASEYSHSHRTFDHLRPLVEKPAPKVEEGGLDGPPGGGRPLGFPGGPGGGAGGGNKTVLDHELWTHRYADVTEQSRRIPVAIVLIVDQDHVDRILNSFNNSNLRFLQSQVLLNYYTGSLQPPPVEDKKDAGFGGGGERKFGPMMMPGRGPGPGAGPGPGGGFMPGGGEGGGLGLGNAAPEMETNMELVIYGVMTLYQRYPPRPAAKKEQQ